MKFIYRSVQIMLVVILANPISGFSQKQWTLQECVDYAVQHNLTVKQQFIATVSQENTVNQSFYSFFPTLNASGSGSFNWGRSVDPFSYTFTNAEIKSINPSLSSSVTIFNGFQLQNTLKQSKLNFMAGQNDLKKIQNDISLSVVSAYLQYLYTKEQLKLTQGRVSESQKQRDRVKAMTDAGVMTQGNLLDSESQLANEELNNITAENQNTIARLSLTQLLELDSIADFDIVTPTVDIPTSSVMNSTADQLFQLAISHLPEIKSATFKEESALTSVSIARGSFMPRLTMFGSLSTGYSSTTRNLDGTPQYLGFFPTGYVTASGEDVLAPAFKTNYVKTPLSTQFDNNVTKAVGVSLSIPIFNGFSSRYRVSNAKLNLLSAETSLQQTKNTVFKSVQQAVADANAAQKKYQALSKSVTALNEAYMYAEKRYNAGLTSSLEFLTATNNLTRGKVELLQAKFDLIFKIKVLDFYAGNPLAF
ncbi:MAG: TolC family protein [Bacteroidota bacterium]|jgi:outer membrane protein